LDFNNVCCAADVVCGTTTTAICCAASVVGASSQHGLEGMFETTAMVVLGGINDDGERERERRDRERVMKDRECPAGVDYCGYKSKTTKKFLQKNTVSGANSLRNCFRIR
jgi:hypothetical protein